MMRQYRIKGTDDQDKTHWLTQVGYWGEPKDAGLFTLAEANAKVEEINKRNLYLDFHDKIHAKVEGAF
jgi:hypothetical protein